MAAKLLKRAAELPKPITPEDKSITTLFIGNLSEQITSDDLHDYFYQFGEIRSINVVARSLYAFVQFTTRSAAEKAIEMSFQKLNIKDQRLTVRWGKSQGKRNEEDFDAPGPSKMQKVATIPGLPTGTPLYSAPSTSQTSDSKKNAIPSLNIPSLGGGGPGNSFYYPSQDPTRMGSYSFKHKQNWNNLMFIIS